MDVYLTQNLFVIDGCGVCGRMAILFQLEKTCPSAWSTHSSYKTNAKWYTNDKNNCVAAKWLNYRGHGSEMLTNFNIARFDSWIGSNIASNTSQRKHDANSLSAMHPSIIIYQVSYELLCSVFTVHASHARGKSNINYKIIENRVCVPRSQCPIIICPNNEQISWEFCDWGSGHSCTMYTAFAARTCLSDGRGQRGLL